MKAILSAVALLAVIAAPAFAESAAPQTPAEPVVEVVPASATPAAGEEQAVTDAEAEVEASNGHDCSSMQSADLTN